MSARAATSPGVGASSIATCRSAASTPSSRASCSVSGRASPSNRRLQSTTFIPKPAARRIISWPMLPTPSRPSVWPYRPCAFEYSFLFHFPARRSATLSGHPAIERQDQREGELGDGDGVLARAVRDVDAARRRGRRRRWCCSRRRRARSATAGPRRASAPSPSCRAPRARRPASRRSPRVSASSFRSGSLDDLAAGGLQPVDAALLELVGDQDFHAAASASSTSSQTNCQIGLLRTTLN